MSEYLSDAEQLDRAKQWMKQYGNLALSAVLVAMIGFFGWNYWQKTKDTQNVALSAQYQGVTDAAQTVLATPTDTGAHSQFMAKSQALIKEHPESAYALQTALLQARLAVERNDLTGAAKALQAAAASKVDDPGLIQLALLRLARVQSAQKQNDAALATLAKVTLPAYAASVGELKGDILSQKGDRKGAQEAYAKAWEVLTAREEPRPLLQNKMEGLGMTVKEIKTPNPVKAPEGGI